MKLAFIADLKSDLEMWAAFAKQHHIDGIELMIYEPKAEDFDNAEEVRAIFERYEIEVAALGVWAVGLSDINEGADAEIIKTAMKFASDINAVNFFTGAGEPDVEDKPGYLAAKYNAWKDLAESYQLVLSVYLGHKGSYITSEALLQQTYRMIPDIGLKLDPVGIIRNVKADPYDVLYRYGDKLTHFHVKGLTQLPAGELEPPPGMDTLEWGKFMSILYHHEYDEYVVIEPHGPFWASPDEHRKKYIQLTQKYIKQFML